MTTDYPSTKPHSQKKGVSLLKKRKFFIGGLVVLLAIGYLIFTGIQSFSVYYFTVSELNAKGDSIHGERIRVGGQVAPGSIDWDAKAITTKFKIADEAESLSVVYKGTVPDTFKPGADVVVEGFHNSAGVFEADTIQTKCPSRYVPVK